MGTALNEALYSYDNPWKDQLTAINGETITYDQIGNPLSYKGKSFEWQRGRLLTKATLADGTVVNMTYYANGLRATKQVGDATHTYYYDSNGNIIQIATQYASGSTANMVFTYDGTGVTGFVADGNYYYFVKNFFGDVTDIYCGTTHVAHYTYDAWGNHTVTDQYGAAISDQYAWANVNPFRYRGYYYDVDLGLYYLQSRYYDPQTGRFINADTLYYLDPKSINGLNLYAYCLNNPILFTDSTGHFITSATLLTAAIIGAIAGAIIGASAGAIKAKRKGDNVFVGAVGGFFAGAIAGAGAGIGAVFFASAATAIGASTVMLGSKAVFLSSASLVSIANATVVSTGALGGLVGELVKQTMDDTEGYQRDELCFSIVTGAAGNLFAASVGALGPSIGFEGFVLSTIVSEFVGTFDIIMDIIKDLK